MLLLLSCIFHLFPFLATSWAETTLQKMTVEEKIGQLFMVAGYVDRAFAETEIGNPHIIEEIDTYITQYHIGAIAYVGPSRSREQVLLTNHYQDISTYPLLIAQDLEWGLGMRLTDGFSFPKNHLLGSIKNNALLYQMGKEIGRQAQLIGVHMSLSPVLDILSQNHNPALYLRSFGDNPQNVAEKGVALIQGLQATGLLASAKHFPGIGAIIVDPHFTLPTIDFQEKALLPFIAAIKAEVASIQTEHVMIPELDPIWPASLSKKIVLDLLQHKLGFSGLIISGALRMKALSENFSQEVIILNAFFAGHDMLLMPQDFPKAYAILFDGFKRKIISEEQINKRVLKILQIKERLSFTKKEIPTYEELHPLSSEKIKNAVEKEEEDFVSV